MTSRDYIKIANVFNREYRRLEKEQPISTLSFWTMVNDLQDVLIEDNENFDCVKFNQAIRKVN